ncbi:NACHT, LRR and PYD domains-containing protein 1b allele 2-like [Poecilia formosa]|uniref:NACHT, LRR and PYD domains-containing protein 1b allele 2-like n=1 Tax=Poecilia formosa TaxID=48698 RepID=UPI0007B84E26|nr:PREDICTED: NACHT, LRR and PYD domains-containing protein 1b allele 2-like [Poecilia formosa]
MVKEFGQQSVEIAREVLTDMTDLDQSPLEVTSEGIPMDFPLKCAETVNYLKDSSSCTTVEPEMKTADPDEAPGYSLQSEAGLFECSVSGLRWFCSERVVFRYRFCSWDGHMERMESRGYRPAGPLLDISLITGRMTEVFLPHWICVDDVRKPLEQFAVLHMDDCGDAVEKVSEVSPSHVKLAEPVFSPRAVLMRAGFPVKVYCNMLLYRTNTAFLTLHVYLIPRDPALQQEMDQRETSYGYKVIRKPDPDMPLKMFDDFVLTADLESAEVCPERLKLRYNPTRPNFFEVYIKNPETDFQMKLLQAKQLNPVWTCALRKDEYQKTEERKGGATGVTYSHKVKHYVEEHPSPLTQKAASLRSDREKLLEVIGDLKQQDLKRFRFFLRDVEVFVCRADGGAAPLRITAGQLQNADAVDLVDLMLQTFSQQAVEKTKEILRKIPRNDLLEALSGGSS